ncbi:unnamed protein product [Heterobilharzia americana]|nr:unnamed protein product [Heterobilharzia americana]CAH8624705.1 unnamed protein product [Heterobilharzia americana]
MDKCLLIHLMCCNTLFIDSVCVTSQSIINRSNCSKCSDNNGTRNLLFKSNTTIGSNTFINCTNFAGITTVATVLNRIEAKKHNYKYRK